MKTFINQNYWVYLVVCGLLGVIIALTVGLINSNREPYCPTEDSCSIDYRDGEWVVTEVTP